jgi:hypothetical protein
MRRLCAQPVAVRQAEKPAEPQIRIRRDRPLARHDTPNPLCWHADLLGEPVLRNLHGLEELFGQELARSYGVMLAHRPFSSMVINDLDVFGTCCGPAEADTPLVVDPDAVLALPIATNRLTRSPRARPAVSAHRNVRIMPDSNARR